MKSNRCWPGQLSCTLTLRKLWICFLLSWNSPLGALYGAPISVNPNRLSELAFIRITGPNDIDSSELI